MFTVNRAVAMATDGVFPSETADGLMHSVCDLVLNYSFQLVALFLDVVGKRVAELLSPFVFHALVRELDYLQYILQHQMNFIRTKMSESSCFWPYGVQTSDQDRATPLPSETPVSKLPVILRVSCKL